MPSHEPDSPFSLDSEAVQAAEHLIPHQDIITVSGDHIKTHAEFIGKVAAFFEALYRHSDPNRIQYEFNFPASILNELSYPEVLKDRLITRTLESVKLTIVKQEGGLASTTLEFVDDDGRLYISRDPEQVDSKESDVIIPKNLDDIIPTSGKQEQGEHPKNRYDLELDTRVQRTPDNEIHAVLYNVLGFDSASQDDDSMPTPGLVPIEWLATIQKRATFTDISAEHELTSKRVIKYSAREVEGELQFETGSINYETATPGRTITMDFDITDGLSVKFHTIEDGQRTLLIPDTGDFLRLSEIIEDEHELLMGSDGVKTINLATFSQSALHRLQKEAKDDSR